MMLIIGGIAIVVLVLIAFLLPRRSLPDNSRMKAPTPEVSTTDTTERNYGRKDLITP
jgi:hypothetical protein